MNPTEEIRINRYLSMSGYCSRRQADDLLSKGQVTINGTIAGVGDRVPEGAVVLVNGEPVQPSEEMVYILLNKPLYITCTSDPNDKNNVIDFIRYPQRIFHVGRLDQMSTGLLLLTNDGELTYHLTKTAEAHEKEYRVMVNRDITEDFIEKMRSGVDIGDAVTLPCKVIQREERVFTIVLTQGLNRQIRRMCEALEYKVAKLKRVRIENLLLGSLPLGQWRHLHPHEITELKRRLHRNDGVTKKQ